MASFNFDELVVDRPYRAHKFDFNGKRIWTATQLQDLTIECGGETVYAVDAVGANIMAFDRTKTGSFTFNNALMHIGVLADQLGSEKEVASETNKMTFTVVEFVDVVVADGAATATLAHTPYEATAGVPFSYIDKVDPYTKTTLSTYELGTTATTNFSVDGNVITLPTGAGFVAGDQIVVKYQYETTEGIAVENGANNFSEAGEFILEVFCYNPCDKGTKKLMRIIFPNAKEDANISLTISNELTHPVTVNAMQDYCSSDKRLFRVEVADE